MTQYKLVPVEPTPEMLKAADAGDDEYTRRNFGEGVQRVMQGPYDHYIAMLAAAPEPDVEPVAWWHRKSDTFTSGSLVSKFQEWTPLYTAPQPANPEVRQAEDELNCAEEVLDALSVDLPMERTDFDCIGDYITEVVEATKRKWALSAKQEPVAPWCGAIIEVFDKDWRLEYLSLPVGRHKLYVQEYSCIARQPAKQPLTEEEIIDIGKEARAVEGPHILPVTFARAIERAHGIGVEDAK